MGTVFKKTATKPLPNGAEIITKNGKRFARWKPAKGKTRTAPLTTGNDGTDRIVVMAGTYIAKFRDGSGIVVEVSTGCRDEDAARSVLAKMERRAELVKAEVITTGEAATADHQATPVADHFAEYLDHLRARQTSPVRVANMQRQFDRVSCDCGFRKLGDLDGGKLTKWLLQREAEGMSAATRNGYRETLVMFANWCCSGTKPRLSGNPLAEVPKANVKTDRRRQRRAMTEGELVKLLQVARMRPLAEYGRKTLPVDGNTTEVASKPAKRSNWTKDELTLDTLPDSVERARERLVSNPEFVEKLERLGRERALIYKTLVLTGLRKGELASLTVGQLELDGPMPFVALNAADEKNRQGSTIPLRTDLAADLKQWLTDHPMPLTLKLNAHKRADDGNRKLFVVPAGLVRIVNRDLKTAGIDKTDERGRTIDVHALRHSFGTLLSKGGVAPRTAQAAMRHSSIDLTMNTYTDPKLLDVYGALDALPSLGLNSVPLTEGQTMRATGTDDQDATPSPRHSVKKFAPAFAPNVGEQGQTVSFTVISSNDVDGRSPQPKSDKNITMPSEKASSAAVANEALPIGRTVASSNLGHQPVMRSPRRFLGNGSRTSTNCGP